MSDWETVKTTFLENWPQSLRSLSIDQVDIPLSLSEAAALGSNIPQFFQCFGEPSQRDIGDLTERLDAAIRTFHEGAFVKLGSRSPKDSTLGRKIGFRCRNGSEAIALLTDCSQRICDDLQQSLAHSYPPHIFARRWKEIAQPSEFRCFMKARKLVGISQYDYFARERSRETTHDVRAVENAIRFFSNQIFAPVCHLDDVVFDLFVQKEYDPQGCGGVFWKATLLEINPFSQSTDPCLFSWAEEFDGSFRFLAC